MAGLTRTRTGVWKSRKVIPADVRAAYGKTEEKATWPAAMSSGEARGAYGEWLADVEQKIARFRAQAGGRVAELSTRQIWALAARWYQQKVAELEDNPGAASGWMYLMMEIEPISGDDSLNFRHLGDAYNGPWRRSLEVESDLDGFLRSEAIVMSAATRDVLLGHAHKYAHALGRLMVRRVEGDYGPDPVAHTLPAWEAPVVAPAAPSGAAVAIMDLFDGYVAERKPAPATVKAWRRQLNALIAFLGHSDAQRVAAEDIIRWKDALLAPPEGGGKARSALTVQDTYLAAARTVFGWAAENRRIASNPAAGVRVRVPKKTKLRDPGFTSEEAEKILKAALGPSPDVPTPERVLARRWVPWLCAYTGARVNEITQLRGEDVTELEGVWTIRITPEAGTVKTNSARVVPLHSHLIDQGFLKVVRVNGKGPLFYNPRRHRGGSGGNPQYKKTGEHLSRWVRGLGITDKHVQPNHGWRHRFKTEARRAEIASEVRDAIQGHAPRSEGERYGSFPVTVLSAAIERLPRYSVA